MTLLLQLLKSKKWYLVALLVLLTGVTGTAEFFGIEIAKEIGLQQAAKIQALISPTLVQ